MQLHLSLYLSHFWHDRMFHLRKVLAPKSDAATLIWTCHFISYFFLHDLGPFKILNDILLDILLDRFIKKKIKKRYTLRFVIIK